MIFKKKGKTAQNLSKQTEKQNAGNETSAKTTKATQTKNSKNKTKWNSRCGDLLPH